MGEHKNQIGVIIGLLALIVLLTLTACSPVKRHARLVKKYPFVHQTDTVVFRDTFQIEVPRVQTDTVMLLDSFLVSLKDTITIEKDKLTVKIMQIHDSIYVDAVCDTVYMDKIIVQKVPVKYYETVKDFNWKKNGYYILFIFLILLLLIILLKVMQFLKS